MQLADALEWETLVFGVPAMNPSELIDKQIEELADWRGDMLARVRKIIREADPDIREDWKWSTGVWTHDGMVCSVGAFADHLKINFFQGAALADPNGIFNADRCSMKVLLLGGSLHRPSHTSAMLLYARFSG
jgi:hypothetical protein